MWNITNNLKKKWEHRNKQRTKKKDKIGKGNNKLSRFFDECKEKM